jgi:hypothetical protein
LYDAIITNGGHSGECSDTAGREGNAKRFIEENRLACSGPKSGHGSATFNCALKRFARREEDVRVGFSNELRGFAECGSGGGAAHDHAPVLRIAYRCEFAGSVREVGDLIRERLSPDGACILRGRLAEEAGSV